MNRRSFLCRLLAAAAAPFVAPRSQALPGPWRTEPTPYLTLTALDPEGFGRLLIENRGAFLRYFEYSEV